MRQTGSGIGATVSATDAKNSFGAVLEQVLTRGVVAITRNGRPCAVMLSPSEYDALRAGQADPLEVLRGEFDALVAHMQTPRAKTAGRALFKASPAALARAASAARRRA